jgi:hypothetical protein
MPAESDHRVSVGAGIFLQFFEQTRFQVVGVGLHFAGGNFFVRRALKTELANSQSFFGPHRRTKHAASHGTGFVELASSRLRIERWTGLVIGEVGELSLRLFSLAQHAADRITRKIRRQPTNRVARTIAHLRGTLGGGLFQIGKSST